MIQKGYFTQSENTFLSCIMSFVRTRREKTTQQPPTPHCGAHHRSCVEFFNVPAIKRVSFSCYYISQDFLEYKIDRVICIILHDRGFTLLVMDGGTSSHIPLSAIKPKTSEQQNNTKRWPSVCLMLAQRLRRWASIKQTWVYVCCFQGTQKNETLTVHWARRNPSIDDGIRAALLQYLPCPRGFNKRTRLLPDHFLPVFD